MTLAELPEPDSTELSEVLRRKEQQVIYRLLHTRRDDPPTMTEIEEFYAKQTGSAHAHTGRRLREMYSIFDVKPEQRDGRWVYPLRGWATKNPAKAAGRKGISARVRGEVLNAKRCAQCGKTPGEDHVKLEVDHKIPHSWGGTDEIENLQPLCTQCNHDKQAFYSSMDPYEEQIRAATAHLEPHRRIGELLKAFYAADVEVPSQVVAVVASMHQYQDDWQKRMRELRKLGWDFTTSKRKENGRMMSYYQLTKFTEWPEGSIRAEITRREKAKKASS
ncbi:HNH endonuclease [Brevibacterium casei]|uniref:HNH endonuclease n=1 Tax=Brevibacterium casei TaxID=33889 RepID=UPI00223B109C|nr:HNH endonuclease [Brevibacterium casei]MCT1448682.1 HNH endonuclease [Brevibacterium casei]